MLLAESQLSHLLQDGVKTGMVLLWTFLWHFSQIYLQVIFLKQGRETSFQESFLNPHHHHQRKESFSPRGLASIQNPTKPEEQAWSAMASPTSWVDVWRLAAPTPQTPTPTLVSAQTVPVTTEAASSRKQTFSAEPGIRF